jgi:cytochrome c oxidase assembly protein Cox11
VQTSAAQKLNVKNAKEYWKIEQKTPIVVGAISKASYNIQNKIAANYYTTQTGFFCNQERALEKKTKIPLRVRLGSLSYTEQLEGY